jgi:hypothetical protein
LHKEPKKRFQSGKEMAKSLKACLRRRRDDSRQQRTAPEKTKRILHLTLIAVVFIVAVVTAAYFLTDKASRREPKDLSILSIESVPAGADVFLNGSLRGQTPLKVDLPLGKYEIILSRQNYYEWEGQIQLDKPGETPISKELVPIDKE